MPRARVVYYKDEKGRAPVLDWLDDCRSDDAIARCRDKIERLQAQGHEARRPVCAHLDGDIHEIRARVGKANYRILFAFHGHVAVVLLHGCTKEDVVPVSDIKRANERLGKYLKDPEARTYSEFPDDYPE